MHAMHIAVKTIATPYICATRMSRGHIHEAVLIDNYIHVVSSVELSTL